MKRQRIQAGAVVKIPLGDGTHTYGRLLVKPYVEVYDSVTREEITDLESIVAKPVLFTVSVFDHAITKGRWPIVSKLPYDEETAELPLQFLQDVADPRRCRLIDAWGNITPASIEECAGLERAAVWEPEHVEDRIRDHYAGRPNTWFESLKLKEVK
jgi:hypothetical protein